MVERAPLGPGAEFDLIRRFLQRVPAEAPGVVVGPGDDCAVLEGGRIAISSDMSVEGVHFRRDWIVPVEIGRRAAGAALSDLAAMAARPIGILVSLGAPGADAGEVAVEVMEGVREAADDAGAALLGGDLVRSPGGLVVDVVVLGRAERPVLRSGARPGDELWVTGSLGGAAAAVRAWLAGRDPEPAAREAFARPRPRIREALWIAEHAAPTAMIDLSDGLAGDAAHLAAASGVAIILDAAALPVHPAVRAGGAAGQEALRLALAGGEDYELCFAAPAGAIDEGARAAFRDAFGIPLSRVGIIQQGSGVSIRDEGRVEPLALAGYRHFGGDVR